MKKIKLYDIEKIKPPFLVGDNYFDQLEKEIQSKVSTPPSTHVKLRIRWALVPALMTIVFVGLWLVRPVSEKKESQVSQMIAQVSEKEILEYLSYSGISIQEIATISPDDILDDLGDLKEINLDDTNLDDLMEMYETEDLNLEEI